MICYVFLYLYASALKSTGNILITRLACHLHLYYLYIYIQYIGGAYLLNARYRPF